MKRRRKVLYVDTGIGLAGGQLSLVELLKCSDTSRVEPFVCTPYRSGVRKECERLGVEWRPLCFESEYGLSGAFARAVWKCADVVKSALGALGLVRLIVALKIDIVHTNNFKAALVAAPACALTGRPMVFHDRIHITHGVLGRLVANRADRIIAVSETVAGKFGGRYAGKLQVIPPGVDVSRFEPGRDRGGDNLVCYAGRISEEKGLMSLVECAPAVLDRVAEARFLIAGEPWTNRDSVYLSDLRRRIRETGLERKFEFRGYVEDVAGLIRQSDVLVLPSIKEPLGRVMIEAMLLEKPVVAFDAGGPSEVIEHGRTGYLARPGDAASLADCIILLLRDARLREEVGREARKSVVHRFSNRVVAERVMDVYDDVFADMKRSTAGGSR